MEERKVKMQNLEFLCLGCMKIKPKQGECPYCHFDLEKDRERRRRDGSHQLQPEAILAGKYLIGKALGEGGFGITYIGWNLNLQIPVAIKEYFPSGLATRNGDKTSTVSLLSGVRQEVYAKQKERFLREAQTLGKFDGMEGIVSIKDYFVENETAYIVMEYLDGEDFETFIRGKGGKLPPQDVFDMMVPVMRALIFIHKEGLIHRDISPDNIRLMKDTKVKLMDFGAAREMSDGEKSLSIILKPGYAPEEQYRTRGNQGPWTDVYALCATMYRAITGKKPVESLDRIAGTNLKRPSELGISINPSQEYALMKGLEVFAQNRWKNVGELYQALVYSQGTKDINPNTDLPPGNIPKLKYPYNGDGGENPVNGEHGDKTGDKKTNSSKNIGLIIAILLFVLTLSITVMGVTLKNRNDQREDQINRLKGYVSETNIDKNEVEEEYESANNDKNEKVKAVAS